MRRSGIRRPELRLGDVCKFKRGGRSVRVVVTAIKGDSTEGRSLISYKTKLYVKKAKLVKNSLFRKYNNVVVGYRLHSTSTMRKNLWFTGYNLIDGVVDLKSRGYSRKAEIGVGPKPKSVNNNCQCPSLFLMGHEPGCVTLKK